MSAAQSVRRSTSAAVGMLALLCMLLSSCASAPSVTPIAAPTRTPPPTQTPAPPPPTLSLQQAWGNVNIIRLPTGLSNNLVFFFENAATPDGQLLVGMVAPRTLLHNSTFISYLAAYNVQTRQIIRVHDLAAANRGISLVATDGNWFIWQEITTPDNVPDGIIRAFNWRTGGYRQYTQAQMVSVAVDQGRALWSQTTPNVKSNAKVQLADLNAGTVSTLATNAWGAALAWPWAGWGIVTDTSGHGYLLFKDLITGQTTQTAQTVGQTLASMSGTLTLSGTTAVFTMYYGSEVDEIPDVSRSGVARTLFDNVKPGLGNPATNGRLAAWSLSAGATIPLVWDRQENALVTLPTTSAQNYVAWTGGHLLVWFDPEPGAQQQIDEAANLQPLATICVVNTDALPFTPPA